MLNYWNGAKNKSVDLLVGVLAMVLGIGLVCIEVLTPIPNQLLFILGFLVMASGYALLVDTD